jgi:hypothetical protein
LTAFSLASNQNNQKYEIGRKFHVPDGRGFELETFYSYSTDRQADAFHMLRVDGNIGGGTFSGGKKICVADFISTAAQMYI